MSTILVFSFSNTFGGGHYYDELHVGKESDAAGQKEAEVGDAWRIKVVVRSVKVPCSVSKLILMRCNVTLELHDGYVFFIASPYCRALRHLGYLSSNMTCILTSAACDINVTSHYEDQLAGEGI